MGLFSTFFNSLVNPIEETVKTVVGMYRMAGSSDKRNNLKDVIFHRVLAAKKLVNPNIYDIILLSDDNFFNVIEDDIALFIFVLLMAESDKHNREFSQNPQHYFFKIESEVIKQLQTYIPNRDANYIKAELLAMTYSRDNVGLGHRPTY
ncbi:hypothetical protein [Chryseobacterium polytrichastri]|uniref:Uncharacterized protein n=1 Tax=Chryseobacterium polytrichastri TaxID=1302687 RepID=A0A1M6TBI2_9FLAO|nr:hypothetical protein [Chryseobacterium polytrichastri]SHK54118.1 hypothetical protein SAMN05444267_100537 [Chryseobacterium polytrichastri]